MNRWIETLLLSLPIVLVTAACGANPANSANSTEASQVNVAASEAASSDTAVSAKDSSAVGAWSQFRGPRSLGVSDAKGLPLKWDPKTNIVWKVQLPPGGASSPILWGDFIYVTSYSGYGVAGDKQDK